MQARDKEHPMFKVTGMTCCCCASTVTKAVQAVAPEAQIRVDTKNGQVQVSGPHDADRVLAAIQGAGFGAQAMPEALI